MRRHLLTDETKLSAKVSTSSLADIAFLLLIFFMIVGVFSADRGIDFAPGDDTPPPWSAEPAVLVEVLPGGNVLVDSQPMPLPQLLGYLAPQLAEDPTKPVILHPRPEAAYGDVMTVFDELRQGRTRLGLSQEINVALPTAREVEGWK